MTEAKVNSAASTANRTRYCENVGLGDVEIYLRR
jgi:hypothetical protein